MSETQAAISPDIAEEDIARADIYRLLALLFEAPPEQELLERLAALPDGETPLEAALASLGRAAATLPDTAVADEYGELFVGAPMARVVPYRAHYTDGQLFGRSLAELRSELARLGIARSDTLAEPEEHVSVLCEIMSGLIVGAFDKGPLPLPEQKSFFERHLGLWLPRFFDDIDAVETAEFYRAAAEVGRVFVRTETDGFRLI